MNKRLADIELKVLDRLIGRFVKVTDADRRKEIVMATARTVEPGITADEVNQIFESMNTLYPIDKYATSDTIEDVMINNTKNIFVYDTDKGSVKTEDTIPDREALDLFVKKLRLYATNESAHGNVMDVHMPTGNRVNIVSSPLGYDITMRNFKKRTLSIIDLINSGELDYQIAARLWVYMDGFAVRPANLLIGGMPASGKTTLLNAMFSFIRPEERIVTIEETYELNTETQENCARLETSEQLPMEELVKNALRMRPDMIIIGETRGKEANDMITAMNIGKIVISTIHASTARDVVNRLQHAPMNVPLEMVSVVDGIIITAQVFKDRKPIRKVTQMSEISGVETQVLLSDLYKFDYKTFASAPILPSITYRDTISKVIGVLPQDILAEESVRAAMLLAMNKHGIRDMKSISETVRAYYDNPEATLAKLGLNNLMPVIRR